MEEESEGFSAQFIVVSVALQKGGFSFRMALTYCCRDVGGCRRKYLRYGERPDQGRCSASGGQGYKDGHWDPTANHHGQIGVLFVSRVARRQLQHFRGESRFQDLHQERCSRGC